MCSLPATTRPSDESVREVPVVLMVFKRFEHTARVLEILRRIEPTRLWVIADGPRDDRIEETAEVEAVRSLVDRGVDWTCEVRRVFAESNLGCARRVSSGLDQVFAVEKEAIILEDDCVPDPTFFRFCEILLDRYRDDEGIAQIGGASFGSFRDPSGYCFSRYNHVWGWATWRRAWKAFDWELRDWPEVRESDWLLRFLGSRRAAAYWTRAFDSVVEGRVDSWAYRWVYANWRRGGLSVLPGVNLVENIGFGHQATNTRRRISRLSVEAEAIRFPLVHPSRVRRHEKADTRTERRIYSGDGLGAMRRWVGRTVRAVLPAGSR